MSDRCHLCGRVDAALKLLEDIDRRCTMTEDEKLPAWRAIKLLYRFGVDRGTCQWIVDKLKRIDAPSSAGFGPTLLYYVKDARLRVEQIWRGPEYGLTPQSRKKTG